MSQRASLSVPSPSPETSVNLGSAWASQDWNSDGFCVNTDGRIWLDANGSKGSSSLSILSNGDAGVGQLLVQSLQKNVVMMAKGTTVVGANGSLLVAGTHSVKINGGIGVTPGVIMGALLTDQSLRYVEPSSDSPSSAAAQDYIDSVELFTDKATVFQGVTLALALLCDGMRFLGGAYGSGGKSTLAAGVSALGYFAKTTAGLVSSSRFVTDGVKGLHLQSVGSVNIGSPAFVSMYSGLATLALGITTSTYGLDAHVIAGVTAGVRSLVYVKLDGSDIQCVGGVSMELASRTAKFKAYAATFQFGSVGGEGVTQVPTTTNTAQSTLKLTATVIQGSLKMVSAGTVGLSADKVSLDAAEMTISSPAYTVKISVAGGVEISVLDVSKVTIDATALTADVGGAQSLEIAAAGVTLGSPSSNLNIGTAGSVSFTAPSVVIV